MARIKTHMDYYRQSVRLWNAYAALLARFNMGDPGVSWDRFQRAYRAYSQSSVKVYRENY